MQNTNRRLDYIDATKGVAILCITFLHFEDGVIPGWLNIWIGMFMISAFYFTSGWINALQNKKITPKEFLRKRIKQLGIPYLWFSLLFIVFDIVLTLSGEMNPKILLREIYKTITLRGIGTLWFIPALIIGEYIFYVIRNHKHYLVLAFVGLLTAIATSYIYYNIILPYRELSDINKLIIAPIQFLIQGILSWPVICIGYLANRYLWKKIVGHSTVVIAMIGITLLAFSIILIIAPPFNIYYLNGLLSNCLPTFGFICLFAIIKKNYIKDFFVFWGKNSLILMCTHYSITLELCKIFDRRFLHSDFTGYTTIVYFFIAIIATYPLTYLFNNKLYFMLGKNK